MLYVDIYKRLFIIWYKKWRKGRNKIEEIYAKIFKAEDSLVRAQFISGTHALAVTLSALLRPNDTMLSITGAPYDTLQTVIGVGKEQT